MARPLRIEFPGAIYHVTSRGDRREPIFVDDNDRHALLAVLEQALARFGAHSLAYCLMGNHYHLVLCTRQGNLSALMRHLNGVFTQAFNRRHNKVGHLFQGRFKAILVDEEAYLLEVCRYVELNPVRARIVQHPRDWLWSSYRAHAGERAPPGWLDTAGLHAHLLGRAAQTLDDHHHASRLYADLVAAAHGVRLWDEALRQQIYLGDDAFIARMQAMADQRQRASKEIPAPQRGAPTTFRQWLARSDSVGQALLRAYTESRLSMSQLAQETNLSVSRVSRLIAEAEHPKSS
ncbi:transposase [Rhizobacter sp. Root1221]|uniref:REP-associated tyrosine transposase n=1 Tax=Rhizobacter sp. Root1221 TaxID=1736433 RepID=UPI0006F56106|nr:transposase [Rhizobacter sp. Root1221]KQV92860.1 transposase [Rhizobacter sp. Root1221]